jgi:rhodanese-related sulfurtransferase
MQHILISILSLVSSFALAADKAKHVDAEGAAKLMAEGKVTIVDVRTKKEYSEGHLKDARNIDIMKPSFEAELAKLDKTKPVLVYCQVGGRSTRALPTFEKLGFTQTIHLDGGFGSWLDAGKHVVKP